MRKFFSASVSLRVAVITLAVFSSAAWGDDRFAQAIGQHNDLLVFGAKGEKVGDYPVPSVSQLVVVNSSTSFQLSYGRDINNLLTAILSPNPAQLSPLHFLVLSKTVDSDQQAVVTLTFSGLSHVSVDPGYIGSVEVDAEKIGRHHTTSNDTPTPALTTTTPLTTAPTARDLPPISTLPTPAVTMSAVGAATTDVGDSADTSSTMTTTGANSHSTTTVSKTYWPEPVTAPDGSTTPEGPNEMKLVAVHGSVSVKLPDGSTQAGTEGMPIPSGTFVTTGSNSSAAVFIGGIESARLMPDATMQVNMQMAGSVRNTTIDLQKGAVFSRIGKRPGETQNYQVSTPEGVAAARGCAYGVVYQNQILYAFGKVGLIDILHDHKLVRTLEASDNGHIEIFVMSEGKSLGRDAGLRMLVTVLEIAQPLQCQYLQGDSRYHLGTSDRRRQETRAGRDGLPRGRRFRGRPDGRRLRLLWQPGRERWRGRHRWRRRRRRPGRSVQFGDTNDAFIGT